MRNRKNQRKASRIFTFFALVVIILTSVFLTYKPNINKVNLGLDLQGGFEVLYQVEPLKSGDVIDENAVKATSDTISRRINILGVSEPVITVESGNRIRVELAGVKDQETARKVLSTQASLTIRDVENNILLDGSDLQENGASQAFDQQSKPMVTLKLKDADKFGNVTSEISKRGLGKNLMVIWMDFEEGDSYAAEAQKASPKFVSAPQVTQTINSKDVQITGNFTVESAKELAALLNSGALPVKLTEIYSNSVGAQFGVDALNQTVLAGIVSLGLIFLFMLVVYRLPGFVASVMLVAYVYIVIIFFNLISGVLTLPGIAAIILGVGMAVDANIIMYERIKEEISAGYSLKKAYTDGAKQSLWTIFDSQITTVIAAIVLFIFGTSSVKGFATMLLLTILVSFITAVFGTRLLLSLLVNSNIFNNKTWWFGVSKDNIVESKIPLNSLDLPTKFDGLNFTKHMKKFFALSIAIMVAGIISLSVFKLNLGIDFSSGTRIDVLANTELTTEEIKSDLDNIKITEEKIVLSPDKKQATIHSKESFEQGKVIEIKEYFTKKYQKDANLSVVSPVIGKELAKNAMFALIYASIGIIIYVALRFEWRMGFTSILALLHDVAVIIFIASILRLEIDITFIAAVLTIVGYSINDTIVTFDRIREHMRYEKVIKSKEQIYRVVDVSLRQTLVRSINTVLTVIITVVVMLLIGSKAIFTFNIALLIGLVFGLYSSLFVASQLWALLKVIELKKKGKIEVKQKATAKERAENHKVLV
ncbi:MULTISPECIES: protein translocase subunit SecD [unclassified Gemella]|uniref:protein translocase subunit SecD n=1 Tax=unclassified Gemella TaxID=2624949 RepID=UPI001C0451DB|nr:MULTISPECIES: protein translocase subunit SecD [unclassified Gemella]MBU0279111.1 protein translocase subunit SecD [Gemella sp. zg-1178]QWQ39166.1 protein translocase subunit SecD [Gemella sp. zg-570]